MLRDGNPAEPFANGGVSCQTGAVCKTISYAIGPTFNVSEVGLPEDYTMMGRVGCEGTIVLGGNTCTITNTAQVEQPTILTIQKVILHDQANIAGVRRFTGETALSVTFGRIRRWRRECRNGRARFGNQDRGVRQRLGDERECQYSRRRAS